MSNSDSYYSIANKLKNEKKITEAFEVMFHSLTLEELIALKLELSARSLKGKLYGFKIWQSIPDITKEAILMYANSAAKSRGEAAAFLGISRNSFRKYLKKYGIEDSFKKKSN